jgi:RNA-directed DNA polymerase
MTTFWPGRATQAQEHPQPRFGNLYAWRTAPLLNEGWRDIRQAAAAGVDRLRAQADERHLDEHMHHLVARLKRQPSRATRVRRQYSPKGDGTLRPLGIPAVAEKRLQRAVTRIRPAIDAPDFLRCRDGYRRLGARGMPSTG